MPVNITLALCLCGREMFGEQEQLFSLSSSQKNLGVLDFFPGSNMCYLTVQMCCILYAACVKFDG